MTTLGKTDYDRSVSNVFVLTLGWDSKLLIITRKYISSCEKCGNGEGTLLCLFIEYSIWQQYVINSIRNLHLYYAPFNL